MYFLVTLVLFGGEKGDANHASQNFCVQCEGGTVAWGRIRRPPCSNDCPHDPSAQADPPQHTDSGGAVTNFFIIKLLYTTFLLLVTTKYLYHKGLFGFLSLVSNPLQIRGVNETHYSICTLADTYLMRKILLLAWPIKIIRPRYGNLLEIY